MQYETKHTKYTQINTNKFTHIKMGPVWQKTQSREL